MTDVPNWHTLFVDLTSRVGIDRMPTPSSLSLLRARVEDDVHMVSLACDSTYASELWALRLGALPDELVRKEIPGRVVLEITVSYRGWPVRVYGADVTVAATAAALLTPDAVGVAPEVPDLMANLKASLAEAKLRRLEGVAG